MFAAVLVTFNCRFSVSIEPVEDTKRDTLPINVLEGLSLHYKVQIYLNNFYLSE